MLKLIYFYCESLRGFINPEFNFSSKYKVHLDGDMLSVNTGDENYIENFYGNNIEINAIVGNNGAGKSSLLKKLYEIIENQIFLSLFTDKSHKILVFEEIAENKRESDNNKLRIYRICDEATYCEVPLYKIKSIRTIDLNSDRHSFDAGSEDGLRKSIEFALETDLQLKTAYITQVLDSEMYYKHSPNGTNYSTGGLMKASFPLDSANRSEVVQYFHREFSDHLDFLYKWYFSSKVRKINIPFVIPDCIKVRINCDLPNAIIKLLTQEEHDKLEKEPAKFSMVIQSFISEFREFDNTRTDSFYDDFIEALLASFLIELSTILESNYKDTKFSVGSKAEFGTQDGLFEFVRYCVYNYKDCFDGDSDDTDDGEKDDIGERFSSFIIFLNNEVRKCTKDNEIVFFETAKIVERYEKFLRIIRDDYGLKDISWLDKDDHYLLIPFETGKHGSAIKCNIKDFYEEYKKITHTSQFLEFDWGLSSGENAMLGLYTKFHKIRKSIMEDNSNLSLRLGNVILLIDEADMLFHPQWQKDYVKETMNIIKQIFSGFNGVQVMISSHSPIMLSDIPKQNIIYLKKENKESKTIIVPREEKHETFGANIFRLFQDTFFLDKTGIGSFAQQKMEELLKLIHGISEKSSDDDINDIKKRISAIGDPYLKRNFEIEFYKYLRKGRKDSGEAAWREYLLKELESLDKNIHSDNAGEQNDKD